MWEHCGDGVDWSGVSGTDPREIADLGVFCSDVKIQKSYLTEMEILRIIRLFREWVFRTHPAWNFRVVDNNNYVSVSSVCPPKLFKAFILQALSHILNGA